MSSNDYRQRCLAEKGDKCEICGASNDIVVHHADGDRSNDDIENLVPLCRPHHGELHNGGLGETELADRLPNRPGQGRETGNITIRAPKHHIEELDDMARRKRMKRASLVREILRRGIENEYQESEDGTGIEHIEHQLELSRQKQESLEELVSVLKKQLETMVRIAEGGG